MLNEREIIENSIGIIRGKTDFVPEIGLILGSGLGDYAEQIENPVVRFRIFRSPRWRGMQDSLCWEPAKERTSLRCRAESTIMKATARE